ncbi:MAG: MBL fold metallo-hydrolase [Bacillota bacterium]|nr:MBL fold metallo-hydrolase [Bacillota bacterium]
MMQIESLTVSMFGTNCYIAFCIKTREAVVIDPGAEGKNIIDKIKNLQLEIKYILNTHGHIDHIGANGKIKAEFNAPVLISEKDLEIYNNPGYGLGLVLKKQPMPDHFIAEGDSIKFGREELRVLETPGHSPGGVCFLSGKLLFSGDSLFAGSVGRTDLAGGSFDVLIKSINEKLITLPHDTIVYPGHGPATTIGAEAESNPFITASYL